jgi:hypothetical protein
VASQFDRFQAMLVRPLSGRARLGLLVLLAPLLASFLWPLWSMHFEAPQYPDGLRLEIYAHTVDGDLQEINTLNHYIGMASINRAELSDLDWIPFALGVIVLLTLRVAAVGDLRALIDLVVLAGYFGVFSMGRFVYKLYVFGHNLDPRAPFSMEPFTPAILGTKQIANFTTTSVPGAATWLIAIFALGVIAITSWQLMSGIRGERRVGP